MRLPPQGSLRRGWRMCLAPALFISVVAATFGLIAPPSQSATKAPPGVGAPNVDVTTAAHPNKRPTADQLRDLHSLPSARAQWNDQWGEPSSLISDKGISTGPSNASPESIARGFLRDHARLFGLEVQATSRISGSPSSI